MIRMQRALTAAMALSVAMLAITARAWAGVDLRSIDVGGYPTVRFAAANNCNREIRGRVAGL